jgi:hypothetical protein
MLKRDGKIYDRTSSRTGERPTSASKCEICLLDGKVRHAAYFSQSISEANSSVRRGVFSVQGSDGMVERVEVTASEVGTWPLIVRTHMR